MITAPPLSVLRDIAGLPVLVWRCDRPRLAISSAPLGGGLGPRRWVLNATVSADYEHPDPQDHLADVASGLGLVGTGAGLATAVDVRHEVTSCKGGVRATVTTGIGHPIWVAGSDATVESGGLGTINAVCWSPVRLSEAALVNAVATVAEAKAQALVESNVDGIATCTDATVVLCPVDGESERYGGPRSRIGSALAHVVHASVLAGLRAEEQ